GRLSGEERLLMEEHPRVSAKIMSELSIFKNVLPLILHHHERWDGSGYPNHLAGSTIPLGARIIAVADVYTALQSPRPYRGTLTSEQALSQMKADAGHLFDPSVVHALTQVLAQEATHADDKVA
ncbi:MAG TPA: HD domain-containing phosphohydrolase, partial [Ktedonobacterales bacterium]|nr:HD domain-containing phosphohydrolase [Ktedonobacterales bacterium]